MYIRNFNANRTDKIPPDYNGTAYTETEPAPAAQPEPQSNDETGFRDDRLMPRRPLIPLEQRRPQPPVIKQDKGGILHNLDFLNRKFTLEDILLAALILMLIGGQNDGSDTDNTEIILILGFLLLIGLT